MPVHPRVSSLCLLAFIAACENSGDAAREQAGGQLSVTPFKLDYTVLEGSRGIPEELENAYPELDLFRCSKWLRVRTKVAADAAAVEGGHAVMIFTGVPDEEFASGEPIGLFYESLDDAGLRDVRRAVQWSPWWLQPPLRGLRLGAPLHKVHYASSSFSIDRSLSPRHGPFNDSVQRLAREISERTANMPKRATLEVKVRVERDANEPSRRQLWVSLVNHGVAPIVLTDPRIPREPSLEADPILEREVSRFDWRIGKIVRKDPYVEPIDWTSLPIPSLPTDAPKSLVLGAGERFELSASWVAPEPGSYLLRAHWDDYDGPTTAVEGQLPWMPLPDDGLDELGSGPYPVRGHAYVQFAIEVSADER